MRICVAGAYGAFGTKHLDALSAIEGVTISAVMGPTQSKIDKIAVERNMRVTMWML
jgi:2-hydroxy-4-carboxymuconate semialdehyde hemiacetal dehydrogenase